ncbi:MAG: metal-dependent hydrolase [Candidatus Aenigmarchaeota archaeon]|nr:metal-dependent hydrolase [Candidatus Aenigmarchaeota archaeon]MBU5689070.1 metal-dependent hydrolase [Candidatus Aenigmarchaeota archaeon]
MFVLAHLGITAFLASFLSLSPLTALIASQLPDLIDKPPYILGIFPSGRYIGHTLLFVLLFGLSTYIITRKKIIALSVSFGMLMHLIEDLPYFIPWFYPFINYDFPKGPFKFTYTLELFILDLIGLSLLFFLYKTNKNFRKEISSFFYKIKQILNSLNK